MKIFISKYSFFILAPVFCGTHPKKRWLSQAEKEYSVQSKIIKIDNQIFDENVTEIINISLIQNIKDNSGKSDSRFLSEKKDGINEQKIKAFVENETNKIFTVLIDNTDCSNFRRKDFGSQISSNEAKLINEIFAHACNNIQQSTLNIPEIERDNIPLIYEKFIEEKTKTFLDFLTLGLSVFISDSETLEAFNLLKESFKDDNELQKISRICSFLTSLKIETKGYVMNSPEINNLITKLDETVIPYYSEKNVAGKIYAINSTSRNLLARISDTMPSLFEISFLAFSIIKNINNQLDRFLIVNNLVWNLIMTDNEELKIINIVKFIVYVRNEYLADNTFTGKTIPSSIIPLFFRGRQKISQVFYKDHFAKEEKAILDLIFKNIDPIYNMERLIFIHTITSPFISTNDDIILISKLLTKEVYDDPRLEILRFISAHIVRATLKLMN